MSVDHSLTYRRRALRNVPHQLRLRKILSILDRWDDKHPFADAGCSNGYLTDIIARRYDLPDAIGYDRDLNNLAVARERHPDLEFRYLDITGPDTPRGEYGLVTCFETLEHVPALEEAIGALVGMVRPGGHLLITVPIEIGLIGAGKFIAKTLVLRQRLQELERKGGRRISTLRYFTDVLCYRDISKYRDFPAEVFHTHFGFDHRRVDRILASMGADFRREISWTTACYLING